MAFRRRQMGDSEKKYKKWTLKILCNITPHLFLGSFDLCHPLGLNEDVIDT